MENTIENKAKFFALYWGQKVVYHVNEPIIRFFNLGQLLLSDSPLRNSSLELTHLSMITDEDAIECHKIHYCYRSDKYTAENIQRYIKNTKNFVINPIGVCIPAIVDYLRSKGYALPWMELSVDELVNIGWIKLKQ